MQIKKNFLEVLFSVIYIALYILITLKRWLHQGVT